MAFKKILKLNCKHTKSEAGGQRILEKKNKTKKKTECSI